MPIQKNALTTNAPARKTRQWYRHVVRPVAQDAIVRRRSGSRTYRGHCPDYLIIGANKCGTTALFQALTNHPSFAKPLFKEVHYLDRFPAKSQTWYFAHFWGPDDKLWGEATPEYFELPDAPHRVSAFNTSPKLILCLRDPVARAVSHYYNAVDHEGETRSVTAAIEGEVAALKDGRYARTAAELRHAYVQRSMYARSLENWFSVFPKNQILILVAERRKANLAAAFEFLSVPSSSAPNINTGPTNARAYPDPDAAIVSAIQDAVRPDLSRLAALLEWEGLPVEWRPGYAG